MSYGLLCVALVFGALAIVGFLKNRTALRNVVFALIGLLNAVVWIAVVTDSGPLLYAILGISLLVVAISVPVLVVALLANGFVMIRRESRTLGNLLSFLVGVLIVAMMMAMQQIFTQTYVNVYLGWAWILAAFVLVYMALAFVVFLLAAWLYKTVPSVGTPRYAIILGARLIDGQVPPLLRARLDKAIELYRKYDGRLLLIPSGGQGHDETMPEGVGMAHYLYEQGIPAEHVIVEDKAVNTRENLELSRALMDDPDELTLVVTNNYHVFRAAMLARTMGLNAIVRGSATKFYYLPSAVLREFMAIMVQYKWLNAIVFGGMAAVCGFGLYGALVSN